MKQGKPPAWLIPISLLIAFVLDNVEIPEGIAAFRPEFLMLTVLLWTLLMPRSLGLITAWVVGLFMDVYYGTPMGQHALAYVLCAFFVIQFNEWLRNLQPVQQAILLLPVFILYEFTLFWIDGVSGQSTDWLWRWAPALTTPLMWPLATTLLDRVSSPSREE